MIVTSFPDSLVESAKLHQEHTPPVSTGVTGGVHMLLLVRLGGLRMSLLVRLGGLRMSLPVNPNFPWIVYLVDVI